MKRIAMTLALIVGLARLVSAQTTPAGSVSTLKPVITPYSNSAVNGGGVFTPFIRSVIATQSSGLIRLGANEGISWGSSALSFFLDGSNVFQLQAPLNVTGAVSSTTYQPTAGTDTTLVTAGDLTRLRYQATITPATAGVTNCGAAFQAAALTADCTIATLPAGMKLTAVYADITVGFTCSGTCTGTKVFQCGTAVNGTQVFAASLNVAVTGQFGLADADLGSGMTRAAAIQGGLIGSWSATTPVSCRFTSGTGNWGSGAATFVNAGSIKFTLITEQVK